MTDEGKKKLTEYLDECWHEKGEKIEEGGVYECKLCNFAFHRWFRFRTFLTWQDTGDLKDKLVEKGEWKKFFYFSCENSDNPTGRINWIGETLFDRERFSELVLAYLEEKKMKPIEIKPTKPKDNGYLYKPVGGDNYK